jgi:hypothetical protein
MKKIFITTIAAPILIVSLLAPMFAFAGSPTIDGTVAGTTAATTATGSTTTANVILKTLKDYGLDQIAYMLAQKLGQKMASAAINKATGGASKDSDPNFVRDFGSILSNIEKQQRDLFTTKLLLNTNPYARNIAKEMIQNGADPLSNFTLGSVVGAAGDWQAVGNDLSLAGKNSLLFYSQLGLPQNTPTGARLLADNALSKQTQQKKETEALKITSSGFLPQAKCNAKISDYKKNVQSIVQNEQQNAANGTQIQQNNNLIHTNDQIANGNYVPDSAVDPNDPVVTETTTPQTNSQLQSQNTQLQNQSNANSFDTAGNIKGLTEDTAGCIEEMISNPIAATQTITTEAGKFGMDMTKNIQGWGQIVAGIFVSLFNGFVNKGLSTLKADYGQVKKSNVGGPEQIAASNVNGVTNFANVPVNIVDLRSDFDQSLKTTEENIETVKKVQDTLLQFPARLAVLDIMLPGPDFIGLNSRLDKYYDHQTAWLQKRSIAGSDHDRNDYDEHIVSLLDREMDISRAEMTRDMNDDTKNIPGAGAIRIAINTFQSRKQALQAANDTLDTSSNALAELRQISVGLKKNIDWLKTNNPTDFGSLPTIVFTEGEWGSMTGGQKDASYAWAVAHSDITPAIESTGGDVTVEPLPANPTDNQRRDLVIKVSWNLWENPELFATDANWPETLKAGFLAEKNDVRAKFSSIRDIIPSDWEIAKNEQNYESYTADIAHIDDLISDNNKMRELIWGTGANENGWFTQNPGKGPADLLVYMIQNKDTLFKSDDIKNALTLPNILNSNRTWEDDGCVPGRLHANPSAQYPSADNGAYHGPDGNGNFYSCYGKFGYTLSGVKYGSHEFDVWIDEDSNQYQAWTHITWPTELYYNSRLVEAIPPPANDTFHVGWKIRNLRDPDGPAGNPTAADGGFNRTLFCRLSSVSAKYGKYSGYALDHDSKNMYCSSKWADVSIADAIGLFIVNQLR